jgi:hypothetical protein
MEVRERGEEEPGRRSVARLDARDAPAGKLDAKEPPAVREENAIHARRRVTEARRRSAVRVVDRPSVMHAGG